MNNAIATKNLNEKELACGIAGTSASWHHQHEHNPTIYIGGLPKTHLEPHILSIFEQYGTITHVNLVKDPMTKESKQFAFVIYNDARSAILAVDNLNAIEIDGSMLRVDHATDYRMPQPESAYDTTPLPDPVDEHSLHAASATVARRKEDTAEKLREFAVMHRLNEMRKKRRSTTTNSPLDNNPPQQLNPAPSSAFASASASAFASASASASVSVSASASASASAMAAHDAAVVEPYHNPHVSPHVFTPVTQRPTPTDDEIAPVREEPREAAPPLSPSGRVEEATRDERRHARIAKERRRAYRASIRQSRAERRARRHQRLQER